MLAICVTCCWPDRSGPAWPGVVGTLTQIKAVYAGMRGRPEQSSDLTLIIGSLRRLHATSWLIWDEKAGEVRLGPRTITWTTRDLTALREVCRILPDPPAAVLIPRSPKRRRIPCRPPTEDQPSPAPRASEPPASADPTASADAAGSSSQPPEKAPASDRLASADEAGAEAEYGVGEL